MKICKITVGPDYKRKPDGTLLTNNMTRLIIYIRVRDHQHRYCREKCISVRGNDTRSIDYPRFFLLMFRLEKVGILILKNIIKIQYYFISIIIII